MDKLEAIEYLNQAKVFLGMEKYDEALDCLNKATQIDKMNIELYLYKGIVYADKDMYTESIQEFSNALKIDKKCGEAYFHIGNIFFITDDRVKGIENYNKAISCGFDDAQLYFNLGLMYEEESNYDLAIRNYSKAIMKDPLRSDARVRKASIYIANNRYPEALETLNELILSDPDLYDGYHLKALLLADMDKKDEALAVLDEAVNLFPKDPAFILDKINVYVLKGETEKAKTQIALLEKEYEMEYNQKRKLELEKSRLFALEANIDSIMASLLKAKEYTALEEPDDIDDEATFLLVSCCLELKKYDDAAKYSKELIEKGALAYAIPSYYTMPYAVAQSGKADEAKVLYKESVSKLRAITLENPEILDGYLFRALCLKEIGDTEKALELCEYLLKIDSDSKTFHNLKAEILMAMGCEKKAIAEKKFAETLK